MSGPLTAAGATSEPSEYATLTMDRSMTGLYTQRSALRDADVPYQQAKFYAASRFDSLIDGLNREMSAKLTRKRRPGSPKWSSVSFPPINSFYPFKYIQNAAQVLRVIADGKDGGVYDATGGAKTLLYTKSAGAGKTRFLGVNTELFFADGVDTKKLIRSALAWAAATDFDFGDFVVDTNLNLQLSIGSQTATITNIQITSNVATVFFTSSTGLTIPLGTKLTFSGTTTVAALSGTTQTVSAIGNSLQASFPFVHGDLAFSTETGSATTGNGTTSGSQPTWATTIGAITVDGGSQWECRGSSVQDWMFDAPTVAPSVTQVSAPSIYAAWAANTWYAPLFVILDSGNLQELTTEGVTGGVAPTFNTVLGGTTTDGTCVWTCRGPATWAAAHSYAVGDVIQANFSYWITVPDPDSMNQDLIFGRGGQNSGPSYIQQRVTVTNLFEVTTAGISGGSTPSWTNGLGTTVNDGTVVWTNQGEAPAWPGATQTLSLTTQILDASKNIQTIAVMGESGATAPTFSTSLGGYTTDNTAAWNNAGPYGAANTGSWTYAYSGQNSVTDDISTASPSSSPILIGAGNQPVIQGAGIADTQVDSIVVWRTTQGGATLIYLDTIPNPGAGQQWIYTDTTPDKNLNPFIAAPISGANNPPPDGFTGPIFHLRRIWGFVGNYVYYSGGPDTLVGNGNSSFPPLNYVPFPEQVIRIVPITIANGGILVFTTTNVHIILGTGTATNGFYETIYMASVGILGFDALDIIGSTVYLMTGKSKFVSLDPSAGYIEAGFPIGDQFSNVTTGAPAAQGAIYSPATTYVTWHEQGSGDTAIYVADGTYGWFRFSPVASPESGYVWSPRAAIVGGTSAVQSVETSPGITQLLIGPPAGGGFIRFRDVTSSSDWSEEAARNVAYPSYDVSGNITLCESGEIAEIAHIALKSAAAGARPNVGILLGEITATATAPFETLTVTSCDPPNLPRSETYYSDRYSALQNGVCPKCDTFQMKIDYGTQDYPDELLTFAVYGAKHSERKQQ